MGSDLRKGAASIVLTTRILSIVLEVSYLVKVSFNRKAWPIGPARTPEGMGPTRREGIQTMLRYNLLSFPRGGKTCAGVHT